MKTGSLRLRVAAAAVALLIVVVGVVLAAVAITYRASLRSDLRHRLLAAGAAVAAASSAGTVKQLSRGLVLEGIATTVVSPQSAPSQQNRASGSPVNPGAVTATGSLLSLTEVLPDRTVVTFTASDAAASRSIVSLLRLEAAIGLAGLAGAVLVALAAARTDQPAPVQCRRPSQRSGCRPDRRIRRVGTPRRS